MNSKKAYFYIFGIIALILLLIFKTSYVIIESGEVGVLSNLGKYSKEELGPGIHFLLPFGIQKVIKVDVRVHSINYKGNKDLQDKEGVIYKPAITVLDERGLPIKVELTVTYRLNPNMAAETLSSWGFNWEEKLVNPIIREVVRDVIGRYPAESIPTKRPEIAAKIEEGIRKEIKNQSQGAVEVVGVQLRNILLPRDIEQKIKEVQIAKQEAEKMKYIEEKARKEQEVAKIKAETEKLKKIIKAKAEAEARLLKAKAEAESNKILSESINDKILKYEALQVQKQMAESIKENKNVKLFINPPQNLHMWIK